MSKLFSDFLKFSRLGKKEDEEASHAHKHTAAAAADHTHTHTEETDDVIDGDIHIRYDFRYG